MIVAVTFSWEVVAGMLGLSVFAAILRGARTPYEDLEDRIRRPKMWALRHPIEAIRRLRKGVES